MLHPIWTSRQTPVVPSLSSNTLKCLRAVYVSRLSQSYSRLNVPRRSSGRCLGLGGSSWPLSWENRPLPWTQPSRLHLGNGSDSVPLGTKLRSDLNGRTSCTTSLPSGSGHSYLGIDKSRQVVCAGRHCACIIVVFGDFGGGGAIF